MKRAVLKNFAGTPGYMAYFKQWFWYPIPIVFGLKVAMIPFIVLAVSIPFAVMLPVLGWMVMNLFELSTALLPWLVAVPLTIVLVSGVVGLVNKDNYHRIKGALGFDPATFYKRWVEREEKPTSHWMTRALVYLVLGAGVATTLVFLRYLLPIQSNWGPSDLDLALRELDLAPVIGSWILYTLGTGLVLSFLEHLPGGNLLLRRMKIVHLASVPTLVVSLAAVGIWWFIIFRPR